MPYELTSQTGTPQHSVRLWPNQSLPARGMAGFVLVTFGMMLLPAFTLLGTTVLWVLLPFLLAAVWGIYHALQRNHRALQITETLTLGAKNLRLIRVEASGVTRQWDCNRYWTTLTKYDHDGPVSHYVTLKGNGREVEIGAFLSEEERVALYQDLQRLLGS
ncbi:MAG: DUF2244 domain-containing protein [Sulfitobacter sp.]